ncbi:MAG: hypothetical protein JJE37_10620 [Methyloceanibacter sp.]|nr:hypothetical protein [Methyloceanibacter sp.]
MPLHLATSANIAARAGCCHGNAPLAPGWREIDISGLTLMGDGAASPPVITLPSCEFHPDIALLYHRARLVAFEVKYLRSSVRQQSLSSAIGQAALYKAQGYDAVGVILVDLNPVVGDAAAILRIFNGLSFFGHIFNKSGSKLISAGTTAKFAKAAEAS